MRLFLTGRTGMVGKAILTYLKKHHPDWEILSPTRQDLDLTNGEKVEEYLNDNKINCVVHTAAKVGGIKANSENQDEFLSDNILMNTHVISSAHKAGIKNLVYLGSSCMYPRDYRNPLKECDILAAPLEPTNEGYAIAKIAGQRLCQYLRQKYGVSYKTMIPCNLYGPGDHYDPEHSHLMAAIIRKIHIAIETNQQSVEIWGSGEVRREFVFVDDLAGFICSILPNLSKLPDCMNIGMGHDYSVNEYYQFAAQAMGYHGAFHHNIQQPSGMSHKLMDIETARQFGWSPTTSLEKGIRAAHADFIDRI
ncbi:MAG: GDP-L-fucose synthase [Alphaproteobacteria bacterium]|nr:GDP-L-fucose synthase [Alphaproteobacteria bacterium]